MDEEPDKCEQCGKPLKEGERVANSSLPQNSLAGSPAGCCLRLPANCWRPARTQHAD
jgi:hypothetical protein